MSIIIFDKEYDIETTTILDLSNQDLTNMSIEIYNSKNLEIDDDCIIIGDEDGAYDTAKETKQTNNIITITNNIELIKYIFDKKKIKKSCSKEG